MATVWSNRELDLLIADVQKIPALLRKRGYGEEDVMAVMHGNWLRVLERGLPSE